LRNAALQNAYRQINQTEEIGKYLAGEMQHSCQLSTAMVSIHVNNLPASGRNSLLQL
jgi:hypothetical protein